ncbi:methyl-accepting chemotaxis protein [Aquincola sp. MAHUQ-54]|uniref:Methyl-accepting chemotaxis protein n=1 Tax=Aquincola agrisoli TaxID=3119538 RepID=A0AAW9Q7X6_9BURK
MNWTNLRIGTRLGVGFATILCLTALMMIIGVWRMQATADSTRTMMAVPVTKERLTNEWFRHVANGVVRLTAVARSDDEQLQALFAAASKAASARSDELVKQIETLLTSDDEKQLFAKVMEHRKQFLVSRDTIRKVKNGGDAAEAERMFKDVFLPASEKYIAAMETFLDYQRQASDATARQLDDTTDRDAASLAALGVLCVLAGGVMAWLLTRSITRPLSEAARAAEAVTAGDLSQRITASGRDEVASLLRSLGEMTSALRNMVQQVRQSADSIQVASSEVSTGNADLSSRTEQTASNLQQTAASMEQLTGTVKQSADSARQANQLAASAADVAARGGSVVSQVVSTMADIQASSQKIADIIGTIDGIAFQTNILALNAAVEAARAGEQGRGFAVVAGEVRTLAQRSAEAAKQIKVLIGASVDKVDTGSRLVADAGKTMQEIVSSVQRVSDIIGEVTAAASEQSEGIGQVNTAVTQLDHATQQNAALVEQSAAAAESLQQQARHLIDAVAAFRTGDATLQATHRAAIAA